MKALTPEERCALGEVVAASPFSQLYTRSEGVGPAIHFIRAALEAVPRLADAEVRRRVEALTEAGFQYTGSLAPHDIYVSVDGSAPLPGLAGRRALLKACKVALTPEEERANG